MGCPKQDRYKHKNRLDVPVTVEIGAVFNFMSGKVRRSPEQVVRKGLGWLWRLTREPKKLSLRDLIDGLKFYHSRFVGKDRFQEIRVSSFLKIEIS